jgi:CRP/FNR family transcriptional regulator
MYALHATPQPLNARTPILAPELAPKLSLNALFEGRSIEIVQPKRTLFWEGDPASEVFEVRYGTLRLCHILPDGRRAVVGFIFEGDVIGLSFRDKYLFTAEAVTEVGLLRMPRSRLHAMADEMPELRSQVLSKLRDEMCAAQDQLLAVLHRSAEQRVATFLVSIAERTLGAIHKGAQIHLCMSRADIADYLGLTVETVCRVFTKLRTEGVISLTSPHCVVIEKLRTLHAVAGEDEPAEARPLH